MKKTVYLMIICAGILCSTIQAAPEQSEAAKSDTSSTQPVTSTNINAPESSETFNISRQLSGEDSIEGFNRTMFYANHFFIRWVFRPVGTVYGSIVPRPGIKAINRFTDNLEFIGRMLSCFCEAKFAGGGVEFLRFLTNTTAGCAGFFEVADPWFGLKRQDEDFGQAFYCWGIGSGCYMFIPGPGPKNVRDTVGTIFDYAFDPKTYFYGGQSFTYLNLGTHGYATYERIALANFDTYEVLKDIGSAQRRLKLTDWVPMPLNQAAPAGNLQEQSGKDAPAVIKTAESPISPLVNEFGKQVIRLPDYHSQGAALDTLRVEMFDVQNDDESLWVDLSWWNSDFINQGSIRSVCVNENRRKMDYKLWAQPDKPNAQLIFIIPGLGSHCLSQTAGAFAEVLFQRGYTVVTMSSSMNWEFMESAGTTLVPGYTPVDAEDVRNAIAAISKDLAKNEAIIPERKHILGYSLGALHTLFIAKNEKNDNKLGIDHYIAINPPVDLRYGMSKIDAYYSSWQADKTAEQALEQGLDAMGKYMIIMKKRHPWKVNFELNNQDLKQNDKSAPAVDGNAKNIYQIDMTEAQAKLLVGYSFKRSIQEVMVCIHHQKDLGILQTPYSWGGRTALYEELEEFTFEKYLNTFIIKHYSEVMKKTVTADELNKASSLRAVSADIAANPKIHLIHSLDDFLQSDDDRRWLKNTFGEQVVFFEHGGHLGNLYLAKMHETICEMLK